MRPIDADALKADYGMKDNCKDCEKELQGYVRQCHYNAVYTKMDFCEWIDSAPTIEPETEEEAYERGYTAGQMAQRKKGKWIRNDNGTWSCDQCQSWIPDEQHYYANWCLFCGSDMRGEQE